MSLRGVVVVVLVGLFTLYSSYLSLNMQDGSYFFMRDLMMIGVLLISLYVLEDISMGELKTSFRYIIFGYFCFIVLRIVSGVGVTNNLVFDGYSQGNSDEIFFLLVSLCLLLVFDRTNRFLAVSSLILYLFASFFYFGFSSQVVLAAVATLGIYLLFKNTYLFLLLSGFSMILFLFVNIQFFENKNNDLVVHKVNNIISLVSSEWNRESIDQLPRSPQVRVVELFNIYDRPILENVIGSGLGGYFTESNIVFSGKVNEDDYSKVELASGRYYLPHNIGYTFLKFGLVGFIIFFYICIRIYNKGNKLGEWHFILPLFVLSFLNFGWTVKFSILLSLVIIQVFKKEKSYG
jgi:hypothetical protein